jgi:TonB family protein
MRKILLMSLLFSGAHSRIDAQQLTYQTDIFSLALPPESSRAGTAGAPELAQQVRRSLFGDLHPEGTKLQVAISDEGVAVRDLTRLQTILVPRNGDISWLDSTKNAYWTTQQKPATTALEGVGARLSWERTSRAERIGTVDAEEVRFEIQMFPASTGTEIGTDDGSFTIFGDLWVAPTYQRYASIGASLWPRAVSIIPTLAELAQLGLIVRSAITIDVLGIKLVTVTSAFLEQSLNREVFTVPQSFRRISPPSPAVLNPKLIFSAPANYPAEAARQKIDGVVVLEITVQKDGSVRNPRIIKSIGFGLDQAAIASVSKWRYTPAERDGVPVEVQLIVNYGFTYRERSLAVPR